MTMVTDYLIALEALLLMYFLKESVLGGAKEWIMGYFALLAIGAFLGGTSHGFKEYATPRTEGLIWKGSLIIIGLTSFCLVSGLTLLFIQNTAPIIMAIFGVGLAGYIWRVKVNGEFIDAIAYYGVATMTSIGITIYAAVMGSNTTYILLGFVSLIVGTVIQVKKIGLHKHFNHNDIFHIFTMVAIYFIFEGLRILN